MEIIKAIILASNQLRGVPRELRMSPSMRHAVLDDARRRTPKLPVWVDEKSGTLRINSLPVVVDQSLPSDGLCVVGDNETVMVLNLKVDQGELTDGKK